MTTPPGSPNALPDTVRRLLDERDLQVRPVVAEEMQAALALLQAHGLRARSQGGHHAKVIAALRAFAKMDDAPLFVGALDHLDTLRTLRATAVYDAELATADDATWARSSMQMMLPEAMRALGLMQPSLSPALSALPWPAAPRVGPEQPPGGPAHGSTP